MNVAITVNNILNNGGSKTSFKLPYDCKVIRKVGYVVDMPSIDIDNEITIAYLSLIMNNGDDFAFNDFPITVFKTVNPVNLDYPARISNIEMSKSAITLNIPSKINSSNMVVLKNSNDGDTHSAENFTLTLYIDYD